MRRNRREKNEAGNQKYIAIAVLLCMVLLIFAAVGKKRQRKRCRRSCRRSWSAALIILLFVISGQTEKRQGPISVWQRRRSSAWAIVRVSGLLTGGKEISCWKRAKLTAFGAASVWMDAKKNINGQVRICIRLSGPQ